MKSTHLLFIFSVFFVTSLFLPSPASAQITFQKTFGGTGIDQGFSIRQTMDGGYIITGSTLSFGAGNADVYLIKTDANGDSLWTKTFGGTNDDWGNSVQQISDGGYIIIGSTHSFGAVSEDVYLIRTDANGNSLWTRTFGGTGTDFGYSVQQTTDGGYIITGSTLSFGTGNADVYLIKINANGDSLWTKTFSGGTNEDVGKSVQQTTDGGYIITGWTWNFGAGNEDVYLIKTDSTGNLLWTKTFGGTNNEEGWSARQTMDGGFIITGTTSSFGAGDYDVYLIKTDSIGNSLWTKTFGGTSTEAALSVQQTTDGGYIITGWTHNFGTGNNNVYLIKTDDNGDSLWTKIFGGAANYENGFSVQQTTDGGYIIVGTSASFGAGINNVYLIKTDSLGNSGCNEGGTTTIITTPATQVTSPITIVISPATIVTTPATIVGSGGIATTLCTSVGIQSLNPNPKSQISLSPNPSSGNFKILFTNIINRGEVQIINAYGAKIFTQNIRSSSTIAIHLKNIPGGIYFVKVFVYPDSIGNGEKYFSNKIVIQQN